MGHLYVASVQVRAAIRENYPVLRHYAYPGITCGNTEKTTVNQRTGRRQQGKNETEHLSITSL
jgi:hypothetical protein